MKLRYVALLAIAWLYAVIGVFVFIARDAAHAAEPECWDTSIPYDQCPASDHTVCQELPYGTPDDPCGLERQATTTTTAAPPKSKPRHRYATPKGVVATHDEAKTVGVHMLTRFGRPS